MLHCTHASLHDVNKLVYHPGLKPMPPQRVDKGRCTQLKTFCCNHLCSSVRSTALNHERALLGYDLHQRIAIRAFPGGVMPLHLSSCNTLTGRDLMYTSVSQSRDLDIYSGGKGCTISVMPMHVLNVRKALVKPPEALDALLSAGQCPNSMPRPGLRNRSFPRCRPVRSVPTVLALWD